MEKRKMIMEKPTIAITMGDPAGIGPEIIVKSLNLMGGTELANCVVVGDYQVLNRAARFCNIEAVVNIITSPKQAEFKKGVVNLIDLGNAPIDSFEMGKVSECGGKASFEYIERAISFAKEQTVHAIATAPINKEALRIGKIDFIGHTEIFGGLCDVKDPLTMFEVNDLRVFFLSRHVSLRRACDLITKERLTDYITRCTEALRSLGINDGFMAIAGLNPHSGEHGLFGNEEVEIITPAINEMIQKGYKVVGPVGADSVFHLAKQGKFNSVLSLFHDQGHIATKTLDFDHTIALTLGLPFLRASVDHGTAYDIAGKGIARAVSMLEAIKISTKYAINYLKYVKG